MKILLCSVKGLGEAAISRSLKRLGYDVIVFKRNCDNYDTDTKYLDELVKCIDDNGIDIVFSVDFLPIVSKACKVYRIIYISWVYDCPEIRLYSKAITNKVNRIFLFDNIMYERFKKRSPENIYYLPLATEPVSDFDSWITDEERRKYSHDVTFVGSMYNEKKRQFHDIDKLSDYLRGYVEGLARAQLDVYGYNFIADSLNDELVSRIRKELDYETIDDYLVDDREIIADQYIGAYVSSLDRERTLNAIADVRRLSIYTDSDVSGLHNIDNCGVADSDRMTPKIFHSSKININITSKTIQSGIPLRILDIMGVRGFVITNYQPEICEYFTPGKDLVVYEDISDLQEKILYYLEHDDEREQIASNGYEIVRENFSYDHLLAIIMDTSLKEV